jgi:hypothetical protein
MRRQVDCALMVVRAMPGAPRAGVMPPLSRWAGEKHDNPGFRSQAGAVGSIAIEADAAQRIGMLDTAKEAWRRDDRRAVNLEPTAPRGDGVTGLVKRCRPSACFAHGLHFAPATPS